MSKHKQGHHGGSWKVAYADFTTAMMALFLTLWLTAQDQKIKEAVARAFSNPFASIVKGSTGIMPQNDNQAVKARSGNFDSASAVELTMLRRISQDLLHSLKSQNNNEEQESFNLELLPEGLRISVFDRSHRPIFEPDSIKFTEYGAWVFSTLAWEIARYSSFLIELEGHTERGHLPANAEYGAWEISSDRANAARRLLTRHGVKDHQFRKVAGFADTQPMKDTEPTDEINRRVTVMLKLPQTRF